MTIILMKKLSTQSYLLVQKYVNPKSQGKHLYSVKNTRFLNVVEKKKSVVYISKYMKYSTHTFFIVIYTFIFIFYFYFMFQYLLYIYIKVKLVIVFSN